MSICSSVKKLFGIKTIKNYPPFPWQQYGMNIHHTDTISNEEFTRMVRHCGPYIRMTMYANEVAENNWYRLEPFLEKCKIAAKEVKHPVYPIIVFTGWATKGSPKMTPDMTRRQYCDAAYELAARLSEKAQNVFAIEGWNEPDHPSPQIGFGINDGKTWSDFIEHQISVAHGIRKFHNKTAFPAFMSLKDDIFDTIEYVWRHTHQNWDFFNFHWYDTYPNDMRRNCKRMKDILVNRPVIVSEHGSQHRLHDWKFYRAQAYVFKRIFRLNLCAVLGYVWDDHEPFIVKDHEIEYMITHAGKPEDY